MYAQLNQSQKKIIATYWIISTIRELAMSFFATTYVLFLLARGLNLLEANLVNTVFFATLFVFEIPTGVVADVWGRKASTVIAFCLTALGLVVYFFARSFLACAVAEAVSAIGFTFLTGAFDAWLVDELAYHGFEDNTRWIFGRSQQMGKIASLAGAFAGALMGGIDLAMPFAAGAFVLTLGGIWAATRMQEQSFERRPYSLTAGWKKIGQTLEAGTAYARSSKPMRFLIAMGIIQSLGFMAPNMQWSPWFRQLLGSTAGLGFVSWGVALALVAGAELARAIAGVRNEKWLLVATQIGVGICIAAAPLSQNALYSLSAFLLHEFGRGFYKPMKDAYLNASISSEQQRATLLSIDAMSSHIGGAVGLVASGAIANALGIPAAWFASGSILILGTLVVARNGNHAKNQ